LGHGLSSSGLFYLINLFYYRTLSRRVYVNKGFLIIPLVGLYLFLFTVANISCPPSIGFFSEIFLIVSVMSFSFYSLFVLYLGIIMVASFSLFFFRVLYSFIGFNLVIGFKNLGFNEYHVMLMHLIPINLLVFNFDILI